jgi:cytoskeletal protein CcmA (bactofilin family)
MALFSQPAGAIPRKRSETSSISLIAPDLTVLGNLEAQGALKVEGQVQGTITARDQVLIAAGATVEGDLHTREAVIGGVVLGTIVAEERVELLETAVVNGNIITARLFIHEGGKINGQITMKVGEEGGTWTREVTPAEQGERSSERFSQPMT